MEFIDEWPDWNKLSIVWLSRVWSCSGDVSSPVGTASSQRQLQWEWPAVLPVTAWYNQPPPLPSSQHGDRVLHWGPPGHPCHRSSQESWGDQVLREVCEERDRCPETQGERPQLQVLTDRVFKTIVLNLFSVLLTLTESLTSLSSPPSLWTTQSSWWITRGRL